MEANFTVREYAPGDFAMVNAWQVEHGGMPLLEGLFPPVGVVVEADGVPLVACWLHLSVGVGVAFIEQPVSRPGLHLRESIAAFAVCVDALGAVAKTHNYGVLIVNTLPAIGRILKSFGFERSDDREKVTMFKVIGKEAA